MKKGLENVSREVKRTHIEKDKLITRLSVIEGQVRGVKGMIEHDKTCDEILMQINAITKSLKSTASVILRNHIDTNVVKDIKNNNLETIDDMFDMFDRLYR